MASPDELKRMSPKRVRAAPFIQDGDAVPARIVGTDALKLRQVRYLMRGG